MAQQTSQIDRSILDGKERPKILVVFVLELLAGQSQRPRPQVVGVCARQFDRRDWRLYQAVVFQRRGVSTKELRHVSRLDRVRVRVGESARGRVRLVREVESHE